MLFKGIMAATTSLALIATPTLATAAAAPVGPAQEYVNGLQLGEDDDDGAALWWLLGGGVVVGVVLWLLLKDDDDDDAPASP